MDPFTAAFSLMHETAPERVPAPTPAASAPLDPGPARPKATALPQPVAQPPPQPPALYQLTDSTGQAWTHADPAWLRRWVASRSPAPAPLLYRLPARSYPACAGGRCPK